MKLFAYLDPAAGSIIIQAVIGAVVGAGYVVRKRFRSVIDGFRKKDQ
jgi:hypothetical protein